MIPPVKGPAPGSPEKWLGGIPIPPEVNEATVLTPYAAALRYPSDAEWIEPEEIADAVRMAERVIGWAEGYLRS